MTTNEQDLNELRAIAEAATPGPWETLGGQGPVGTHAVCHRMEQGTLVEIAYRDAHFDKANATHIAAFDPPTVLTLLDRVEAAEQAVQRVRELHVPIDVNVYQLGIVPNCEYCYERSMDDSEYPCSTIRALDGGEQE